jgi:hypothetical protein
MPAPPPPCLSSLGLLLARTLPLLEAGGPATRGCDRSMTCWRAWKTDFRGEAKSIRSVAQIRADGYTAANVSAKISHIPYALTLALTSFQLPTTWMSTFNNQLLGLKKAYACRNMRPQVHAPPAPQAATFFLFWFGCKRSKWAFHRTFCCAGDSHA